jgi:hypothetical protein
LKTTELFERIKERNGNGTRNQKRDIGGSRRRRLVFGDGGEIGHFLLKHGVEHKPAGLKIDTPLDYGDYYYLEALLRL